MSADNEPVGGGGRGKGGDLPPAYGEAMKNQGEHGRQFGDQADCGPFGPASSLGPSPVRYIDMTYRLSIYRHF